MNTWIKICGVTNVDDALSAVELGASAIGMVFAPSPRRISIEAAFAITAAVRGRAEVIGVFKEASRIDAVHLEMNLDRAQIHDGDLDGARPGVLRTIRPEEIATYKGPKDGELTLVDGSEGTGTPFDWTRARRIPQPFVLAGGLTPENVGRAIAEASPFGVDVCSGIEVSPGVKDLSKMRRFFDSVRRADARR